MKNLKLLSKKLLFIIFILFTSFKVYSSDKPVDIWKINEKNNDQNSETNLSIEAINDSSNEITIYNNKSNDDTLGIIQDSSINSKKI